MKALRLAFFSKQNGEQLDRDSYRPFESRLFTASPEKDCYNKLFNKVLISEQKNEVH
ncbi:MAG: hypothetical protein LBD76_03500 [Prevotellaceae bacterium]|jgi:hypothetical protein|nr:hypothetical protein [Prevotellaceae bacterium]